mgnify:FL=1
MRPRVTLSAMFQRMKSGWELTKKSWRVVRADPKIARLPIYGGALALLASLLLGLPGTLLMSFEESGPEVQIVGGVLIALGVYMAAFFVTYFNVALAAAANQALMGVEPDIAAARRVARGRIGTIAAWAAISVLVSLVLRLVREKAGFLGDIVAAIGGAIWSLVTFLVIPVMAFEDVGPIDAMKRSTKLFRERWGQQVTGNFAIGGISSLVMLVGVLIGVAGVFLLMSGSLIGEIGGGTLLLLGIVVAIVAAVFGGAVRGVFGVALYYYVAEDREVGPFTATELASTASSGKASSA